MHWASIATALTLSLALAFLVFILGWAAIDAFLAVIAAAVALLGAAIGSLWLLTAPEERPDLRRVVTTTMRKDLDDTLRWFRLRK